MIDDDIAQGFAKLEQVVANKAPLISAPPPGAAANATDRAAAPSAFEFRGGPRYTPILLAVVLPFAWLAVMYFALANLLSETALDRGVSKDTEAKLEQLERELQAVRSEISGAPRTAKSKPKRPKAEKQASKPADATPDGEELDGDEPPDSPPAGSRTNSKDPS